MNKKSLLFILALILLLPLVSAQATVSIEPYPKFITAAQNISITIVPGAEGVGNSVNIEQNEQVIASLGAMCAESKCYSKKSFIFYVPSNWKGDYSVSYTEYIKEAGNIVARPAKSDFTVYPKGALDISKVKETLTKTTGAGSNAFSFDKQLIIGSKRISFNIADNYKEEFYNQIKTQISENMQLISDSDKENSFVLNIEQPENQITEIAISNQIFNGKPNFNMEISAYNGYIVEFKEKPLVVQKTETENKITVEKAKIAKMSFINPVKYIKKIQVSGMEKDVETNFVDYKTSILKSHSNFIKKLENKGIGITGNVINSKASEKKILSEYTRVFNGIAMDVSAKDIEKIRKMKEVKAVYKNEQVKTTLTESVPQINADDVWDYGYTGKGITIAIIDTGIDYTHPDLGGCLGENCKVIGGYDFVNYDNDPMDDQGHGTHCAGIAAGNGAIKGVAPDAKLLAYKVLDSDGNGYLDTVISGIERAADPNNDGDFSDHADVISLSLGGYGDPDDPASTAIDNVVDAGVVAAIAAGNSGPGSNTIGSPGTARKAITVGATYKKDYSGSYWGDLDPKKDQITSFSSRGPVEWAGGILTKPDVVAPGAIICSAQYDSAWNDGQCFDDKHVAISGTSMATPHVAGASALLLEAHPDWTPDNVKSALMLSAIDLGYDANTQGAGRIDVMSAVNIGLSISPSIMDFGNIGIETQKSETMTIKNMGTTSTTINLAATGAKECENCTSYDVALLNISSLTLEAGESADILVSLNVPSEAEGNLYGRIIINTAEGNYSIPYLFQRLSKLTLFFEKMSPNFCIVDDNLEKRSCDYLWGNDELKSYTFYLKKGNYTLYTAGDNDNFSINYALTNKIEIPSIMEKEITVSLSDARPFTIKAESKDGKKLKIDDWHFELYSGLESPFQMSFGYSGFGFYGDRIIYLSNRPSEKFDTDVILRYSGVPARSDKSWNWDSISHPTEEEFLYNIMEDYETANEQYLMGWILHNINENTETTINYNNNNLAVYNYYYNYPAYSVIATTDYSNIFFWMNPYPKYGGWFFMSSWTPLAVPLKRVYYVFGDNPVPERYQTNWTIDNFMYINYLKSDSQEETEKWMEDFGYECANRESYGEENSSEINKKQITPVPGHSEDIYFGKAPFIPTSIVVEKTENCMMCPPYVLKLKKPMIRGYNGKTNLYRYTEIGVHSFSGEQIEINLPKPTYKLFSDSILKDEGNITGWWGEWDYQTMYAHLNSSQDYIAEIEIPSNYPIFNITKIRAKFNTGREDMNPPSLKHIEISPRFKPGNDLNIDVQFSDSDISEMNIYYNHNNDNEWHLAEKGIVSTTGLKQIISKETFCENATEQGDWMSDHKVTSSGFECGSSCPDGWRLTGCATKKQGLGGLADLDFLLINLPNMQKQILVEGFFENLGIDAIIGGIIGGVIGFFIGGPAGAIAGAEWGAGIGAGLSATNQIILHNDESFTTSFSKNILFPVLDWAVQTIITPIACIPSNMFGQGDECRDSLNNFISAEYKRPICCKEYEVEKISYEREDLGYFDAINLRIYAEDTSGNSINYEITPVSLLEREISLNAVRLGNAVDGKCVDNTGQTCNGLRVEILDSDKKVIGAAITRSGKESGLFVFNSVTSIPAYVRAGGTGVYSEVTESIGIHLDSDKDNISDTRDNCPNIYNPEQEDDDKDEIGNVCDNCLYDINPDQADSDNDLAGDICDNCLLVSNPPNKYGWQEDEDSDNVGDYCDNCWGESNEDQADSDNNGIGDACFGKRLKVDETVTIKEDKTLKLESIGRGTSENDETLFKDIENDYIFSFQTGIKNKSRSWIYGDDYYLMSYPGKTVNQDYVVLTWGPDKDNDKDGIIDKHDNCQWVYNPGQEDYDNDDIGDVCDNCPGAKTYDYSDINYDGVGDYCYGKKMKINDDVTIKSNRILKLITVGTGDSTNDITKLKDINSGEEFAFATGNTNFALLNIDDEIYYLVSHYPRDEYDESYAILTWSARKEIISLYSYGGTLSYAYIKNSLHDDSSISFEYARDSDMNYDSSCTPILADYDNRTIHVKEGDEISLNEIVIVNAGDNGVMWRLASIGENTNMYDKTVFRDQKNWEQIEFITGKTGKASMTINGEAYYLDVTSGKAKITWGNGASYGNPGNEITLFPRIKLEIGEWIAFLTETSISPGNYILPGPNSVDDYVTFNEGDSLIKAGTINYIVQSDKITGIDSNNDNIKDVDFSPASGPAVMILEQRKQNGINDAIIIPLKIREEATNHIMSSDVPKFTDNTSFPSEDNYPKLTQDSYGICVSYDYYGSNIEIIYPGNETTTGLC